MKTIRKNPANLGNAKIIAAAIFACVVSLSAPAFASGENKEDEFKFDLVRSKGLTAFPTVAPDAYGRVKIESLGPVEVMEVKVWGLPPNTDFDFFVIQVPNFPFGLSWYQGDIETNKNGVGYGRFIGRFNIETFIVSPASLPAPIVFTNTFPDVSPGPKTGPIHTYHLGLWFNDPKDVVKAGGPATVTPFNGEHNAGVQVLNTGEFLDLAGPLKNITTSSD
jgi:hypothetical protein